MSVNSDDLEARVRKTILAYVAAHPSASDTAQGIARWWLGAVPVPAAVVICVLDRLAEEGRLVRTQRADGEMLYSMSKAV